MKIYNPDSISEAIGILDTHNQDACLLAGGTDFVVKHKEGALNCKIACNIYGISELRFIHEDNEHILIGSLATHQDIIESSLILKYAPVLADACRAVGSPQIRNRGTIGGNIGTASPAGDTLPVLMVLEADVNIISAKGERTVNIRDFFLGPGKTILKPNEMIKEIVVPKMKADEVAFYSKLGMRNALAISMVGVAAKVKLAENMFEKVEVSLGSVAPTVVYNRMTVLEKQKFTKKELWDKVQLIKKEVNPITDVRATSEYRKKMSAVLLYQCLRKIMNCDEKKRV